MSSGSSVEDRSKPAVVREGFFGDYYEHLAEEDARGYAAEQLTSRAAAHREAGQSRKPGTANVRIANEGDRSILYIVTDDMPFLVDSVNAELVRQNCAIRLVMHPLFVVSRDHLTGDLSDIARVPSNIGISSGDTAAMPNIAHLIAQGDNVSHMESWIAVEVDRVADDFQKELVDGIHRVLNDVRAAVEDWPKMRTKALELASSLDKVAHPEDIAELRQAQDLLRWLDNGNFTFLGYREYDLITENGEDVLELREASGLGLLRAGTTRTKSSTSPMPDAGRRARSVPWSSPKPTRGPPFTALRTWTTSVSKASMLPVTSTVSAASSASSQRARTPVP
ncbi:NAD-specific glutamate dehydrogenase [Arthrobacter sp. Hiyo8]|nr:NAD-specific glutamate dehydrogenase [Arthrobacter sp. Hiyo8]